jgi:dienelactone hydrolase
MRISTLSLHMAFAFCGLLFSAHAEGQADASLFEVPEIESSWSDLTQGIETPEAWQEKKSRLKKGFLELIRDQYKPDKPPLELEVHESVVVENAYTRKLISYNVEKGERAHAYLGIPLKLDGKAPGIVALHGTFAEGIKRTAGLVENPDKAYLDHLARRGYIVIAPEHFVSGHRIPPEGPYHTKRFYEKHPEWTAVGKFTYEHSIAIDVLETLEEVDHDKIGALGHSLGGQGTMFLAAYDERIKAAAANCAAPTLRHNERVTDWARDHWYIYLKHIRPGLLKKEMPPVGFHDIISLIAPRAFLDLSATNDGNPGTQRQRILMLAEIMKVYEIEETPQNFAFYTHGRGHAVPHESRQLIYGWMDTHLKPSEATQTRLVEEAQ